MLPIFILPQRYLIIGVVLVLGLGMAAGIFPALQAMRLRTAVALGRHE
jgi:putative ABC transport system permease protein